MISALAFLDLEIQLGLHSFTSLSYIPVCSSSTYFGPSTPLLRLVSSVQAIHFLSHQQPSRLILAASLFRRQRRVGGLGHTSHPEGLIKICPAFFYHAMRDDTTIS